MDTVQIKPGDLVEAVTFCANPRTIRVRVTRAPDPEVTSGTLLVGGAYAHFVKTDTIRVIDETPAEDVDQHDPADDEAPLARWAVAIGTDEREWIGFHDHDRALRCANEYGLGPKFIHDRHREVLRDDVSYAMQWRTANGKASSQSPLPNVTTRDEADAYVAGVQHLVEPGIDVRVVEIRVTHTALPAPAAPPAFAEHGPVAAGTLRSGCRVDIHGAVRLVWKVEYRHVGGYLRLHTVPPGRESAEYYVFTFPGDTVELISRGPAVDVAGRPVDDAR
ncbi:hypothetical protein ACFVJK_30365 [Streptomyces sp. NPDC127172]|uniref:hypothetical protein n=1 Tax=Streptomyces sp. NPDC127172 TaxID=3345382 RepID=UPI0036332C9E